MNEAIEVQGQALAVVSRANLVEVKSAALVELLEGALLHACKDKALNTINCVLVSSEGGYLTATATDRYRLGEGKIEVNHGTLTPALVPADDVKRILTMIKANKLLMVSLSAIGDTLTVSNLDSTLTIRLDGGTFPPSEHLFAAIESAPVAIEGIALNPLFFADYAKIAGKNNPVRIYFGGESKPMRIRITSVLVEWRLLLMPMRFKD